MPELFLVRHAQASFGEDDYDRLSELGNQQARWLGEYFHYRGLQFDRVICGDMTRHQQTLIGIASGMGVELDSFVTHPQWNEFDFQLLVAAYLDAFPQHTPPPDAPRGALFQVLKKALHAWSEDGIPGALPETWDEFEGRIRQALTMATDRPEESGKVLVVSSGGSISMAVRHILAAPPAAMVQMNLQTRNSSFTHCFFNQRGVHLSGFNHVPHLDHPDRSNAVTYY